MKKPKKTSDNSFTIVVLTAVFALIGTVATAYFNYKANLDASMIPIKATQTAESRLVTQAAEARLETQAAGQLAPTSTLSLPTETLAEASPTVGFVNTDTPVPTPTLSLPKWDIFSTDNASFEPSPQGDCPNLEIDELGIHTLNCDLLFGKGNIKRLGTYGLSIPIKDNVKIQMSVNIVSLIEGEFWIGFSDGIDPQPDSLIYAMTPDPGGVFVYLSDIASPYARYAWANMGADIGWVRGQPRQYNFTIRLEGNRASVIVNSVSFTAALAPSTDRLFLGYRSKPNKVGTYVDATISKLTITDNR